MADVTITEPNLLALAYIAANIRDVDAAEVFAGAATNPDILACDTLRSGGVQWIAWADGVPVASFGGTQAWPGVWSVWMWATDRWPDVALSVHRQIKRVLIPELLARGGHRGQCASLATHTEAHRWLESLGFQAEGTLRGFGRAGEDFIMYGWRA